MPSAVVADAFLDIDAPLWSQLVHKRWTKAYYLEQVHKPRYSPRPVIMFENGFLEMLTRTAWYVIPAVWLPIVALLAWRASSFMDRHALVVAWMIGLSGWTLIEYVFHRFLFHIDALLPEHQLAYIAHFCLHGFHHFLPMDRYRLVMPPVLFASLCLPWFTAMRIIMPPYFSHAFFSGMILGYVGYDLFHYSFHHAKTGIGYLQRMKRTHLAHHYSDSKVSFGVTSSMWDGVFGTVVGRQQKAAKAAT